MSEASDMGGLLLKASLGVEGADKALDEAWALRRKGFAAARAALEAQLKALEVAETGAAASVEAAKSAGMAARAMGDAMRPWGIDPSAGVGAVLDAFKPFMDGAGGMGALFGGTARRR